MWLSYSKNENGAMQEVEIFSQSLSAKRTKKNVKIPIEKIN